VDNLAYAYSGNGLSSESDASGVKAGSSSYGYDGNGNMTSDGNRGAVLTYNYLNLPKTVAVGGKTLTYDYDAAGTKYKYVADTLTVKYAGGFEYNASNAFTRLSLSEGQAVLKNNVIAFQYYVKDHLGNVRVVFDEKGAILQKNDYYPFGLSIDRNSPVQTAAARNGVNRYLYNDNELQVGTGYLDYGARMYMPEIGRWGVVDPMAEKGRRWSPYAFSFDNPMRFIDPDGMWPYPINIRSFAPFKEFGGWFAGDNRGYSTASNVSSRLAQSFTVDPSTQSYSGLKTTSSASSHPLLGTATATDDKGSISNFAAKTNRDGSNTVSFTSSMSGHNPLVKGSSDIDVQTKFTMTENLKAGTLNVSAVQTGDAFPSAETFMGDTKGNQLFIGVSPANGGPYTSLPFDNNRLMMSAKFTVTMDGKGAFTGVKQGDKTYTPGEWNKMNQNKPTEQ
jgi:RHS repeat-associated protein